VAFGKEHIPQAQLSGLLLQVLDYLRAVVPAISITNLCFVKRVGSANSQMPLSKMAPSGLRAPWTGRKMNLRDAAFFYKLLDNVESLLCMLADSGQCLGVVSNQMIHLWRWGSFTMAGI
jgi:hypothetical protein